MFDNEEQSRLATIYENLRERLLDLSLRNSMLNFRHRATSKRQLQIISAVPDQVYRKLVADGLSFELIALPDPDDIPRDERTEEFLTALAHAKASDLEYLTKIKALESAGRDDEFALAEVERDLRDRLREQLRLPPRPTRQTINPADHARGHGIDPSLELQPKPTKPEHSNRWLQTLKWDETLAGIMEKICEEARLAEQEMGLSTLFLVFGFLEWYEAEGSSKKNFAPLLLLPVSVCKRKNGRGKYTYSVVASAESADTNLSLRRRVQNDFNRVLPDFQEEDEEVDAVENYFESVTNATHGLTNWKVRRWVTLGHFSFGRFAMYADLDQDNWPKHPVTDNLVGAVLRGTELRDDGESILSPPDDYLIDDPEVERLAPFLVHDADASQHSVLIDAMKGMNLVVQGPPGTGKSQTITNIIANALAENKTILFMAEKQAALDVVKRRLDRAGLGEFCLELHSSKAIPKQVIESLKSRHKLGYRKEGHAPSPMNSDKQRADIRRELTQYLSALHAGQRDGRTPFSLIWSSLRARREIGDAIEAFRGIGIPPHLMEDPAAYGGLIEEISLYARIVETYQSMFGLPSASPWSSIKFGERAGPGVTAGLLETLDALRTSVRHVLDLLRVKFDPSAITFSQLGHLLELDRTLPAIVPPSQLIIRLSKLETKSVEELSELKIAFDAARESAQRSIDLSAYEDDRLRLLSEVSGLASLASISNRKPMDARIWARKEVQDCAAIEPLLQGFLSAIQILNLDRLLPARITETLYIVILAASQLNEHTIAWFRWIPADGQDAFNSVRREWSALTQAEKEWRAKYSALRKEQWPVAEALMAAATRLRKGPLGKVLGKISGKNQIVAIMAGRLG